MNHIARKRFWSSKLAAILSRYRRDERANIAILFGLLAPVLIGALGLGLETSWWYQTQRDMQNAADEAALAAATNAGSSYNTEALAVSANYGYTNGANNTTVTASNTASCPSGGSNCYSVTITTKMQLYLTPVIGYTGNTTVNGSPATTLTATAVAKRGTVDRKYCLLSLNSIGTGILGNGVPNSNFKGCSIMSDSSSTCNGHNMGADYGDAHVTDNGCGVIQDSNVPSLADPYKALASNIPENPCDGNYPQEPSKHGDPSLPSSNQWSGSKSWGNTKTMCGDVQLTGDTTITGNNNVLVIENGQLDTNGYTLKTASGSDVTVIFSGDNSGTYTHAPTGGGTLDIAAPTSGTWAGVAMYQDPSLTSGVDVASAGNSPTWDISGIVYLPKSNVTFKGAVNKSSNGQSCFVMVVGDITVDGTGAIFENGACDAAGVNMPTNTVPGRGQLVL